MIKMEQTTENWATGTATAMKSGSKQDQIQVYIPKHIQRELKITKGDILLLKVQKNGRRDYTKITDKQLANLNRKGRKKRVINFNDLDEEERQIIEAYNKYGDKALESAYSRKPKEKVDLIISLFGVKKDEQPESIGKIEETS